MRVNYKKHLQQIAQNNQKLNFVLMSKKSNHRLLYKYFLAVDYI